MKTSSPKEPASKRAKRRLSSLAARGMRATLERTSVQKIYESMVWNQIQSGPIPEHIGVILDGNRRWARSRGLAPWKGHEQGARKMEDFLDWCGDISEIRSITLYAFSTENFQRSEKEVTEIFRLLKEYLNSLLKDERVVKNEIRVKMLGRIEMLPEEFQELIRQVEEKTGS